MFAHQAIVGRKQLAKRHQQFSVKKILSNEGGVLSRLNFFFRKEACVFRLTLFWGYDV